MKKLPHLMVSIMVFVSIFSSDDGYDSGMSTARNSLYSNGSQDDLDVSLTDDSTNQRYETLLMLAVMGDDWDDVNMILRSNPDMDVNAQDRDGFAALHFAARNDNRRVIEALLQRGARINIVDHTGSTPLHAASINFAYAAAGELMRNGANPNIEDNEGKSAFDVAESNRMLDILHQR